jgi:adiponectin receptor
VAGRTASVILVSPSSAVLLGFNTDFGIPNMVQNMEKSIYTPSWQGKDGGNRLIEHWYSLVGWDDLPHWQQDNHHIHGSYRRPSGSYHRSIASLSYIHNETVNIYTHLIPALITLPGAFVLYKILQPRYVRATESDVVAFSCFFLGTAVCLGLSATYHITSNVSPKVNKIGNRLDYVGIVLLISGSFVPSIYYGFWCVPKLQRIYWAMVD